MSDEAPHSTAPRYTNVKLIGANFAVQFFPDTHTVELKIAVLDEMWQDLQALCKENEWNLEEGLRTILANGLAYLHQRMSDDSTDTKETRLDLLAQYSVMKYRAFEFMQAAQSLDWKVNAMRSELELVQRANEDLRARLQQDKRETGS
jgi:hypothetical protein